MILSLTRETREHECQVASIASFRGAQLLSSGQNWWIADHNGSTDWGARFDIARDLECVKLLDLVCDAKLRVSVKKHTSDEG